MAEQHIDEAVEAAQGAHPPGHEAPSSPSHGAEDAVNANTQNLSGIEDMLAKVYFGPLGYAATTWKAIPAYFWAASTAAYSAVAGYIAVGVAAGSMVLKYFMQNYFLRTKFGKEFYAGAKDIALNSFTYAKNFLTATGSFIKNVITSPSKILPVYGASDAHGAAPKEALPAPHPA